MKSKIIFIAFLCVLAMLVSCAGKTTDNNASVTEKSAVSETAGEQTTENSGMTDAAPGSTSSPVQTTEDTVPGTAEATDAAESTDEAMTLLAVAINDSGLFGSSMDLLVKGDDFASDLLEFTYGIEDPDSLHIADYVISEQTSKEAYTFAFFVFDDGFTTEDFGSLNEVLNDIYVSDLASAVEVYNPEAYAMCEDALIEGWNYVIDGGDTVHCAYLIISDDNRAAAQIATDAVSSVLGSD